MKRFYLLSVLMAMLAIDANAQLKIVQNGGKLVIHKGSEDVAIHNSFECKKGAVFEIK